MEFNLPKNKKSIIKVIGVGGGGGNAVNHMYNLGIEGVDFAICNTDNQALNSSPVPTKLQLGQKLTEGLGAGANPEVGKESAIETQDEIKQLLGQDVKMAFITAGMGGGTGTGAAPIIAQAAQEIGVLTVAIVTMPFSFEGKRRIDQAKEGIEELRSHVDTLIIINNDKLRDAYGSLKMSEAFKKADDVLTTAAKGIADIITGTGYINVDFEDVKTVMKNGGTAIMSNVTTEGENRAFDAATEVLVSPLLNDNEIKGAKHILINITSGENEVTSDEIDQITAYIQSEAGNQADVIWGLCSNSEYHDELSVTVIATGFSKNEYKMRDTNDNTVVKQMLEDDTNQDSLVVSKSFEAFFEEDFTPISSMTEEEDLEPKLKNRVENNVETSVNKDIQEEDRNADNDNTDENRLPVSEGEVEATESREATIETEKKLEQDNQQTNIEADVSKIIFGLDDTDDEIAKKEEELNQKKKEDNQINLFENDKEQTQKEQQTSFIEGFKVNEKESSESYASASYSGKLLFDETESDVEKEKSTRLISKKLQSSDGISEIESLPAYLRHGVDPDKGSQTNYVLDEENSIKKKTSFIDKSID